MTRNQAGVAKNPYQTDAKRVLCCCAAGALRSPTAANVLHREKGYNTRACGIDEEFALIPITETLLFWADEVVCMDLGQMAGIEAMLSRFGFSRPVLNLGIEDNYSWGDIALENAINQNITN